MNIPAALSNARSSGTQATHRGMFAVDIAAFSSRHDPAVQRHLRNTIHRIIQESYRAAGLNWERCHYEDRGDGLFVIVSPEASIEDLLGPLVSQVFAGVREHNKMSSPVARIQLRLAVHAGYVYLDEHGVTGMALIHLFRLLDTLAFKAALADSSSDFALIVSHYIYEEVISYSSGLIEATAFRPIAVQVKETVGHGWVWLPPAYPPYPASAHQAMAAQVAEYHDPPKPEVGLSAALHELAMLIPRLLTEAGSNTPPVAPIPPDSTVARGQEKPATPDSALAASAGELLDGLINGRSNLPRHDTRHDHVVDLLLAMKQHLIRAIETQETELDP